MKEEHIIITCDRCHIEKQYGACGWVEFHFSGYKGDLCRKCFNVVNNTIYKYEGDKKRPSTQ